MSKWIFSLGLALVMTACATPQQPPAQASAAPTARGQPQMVVSTGTQPAGQKLICSESYPMGSHIPQRICVTPEQAAARKKAAQEAMQNVQMQGTQSQGSGNNPP